MRVSAIVSIVACVCLAGAAPARGADTEGTNDGATDSAANAPDSGEPQGRKLEWSDADCEPGDRVAPRDGEHDARKLERWFCRPRRPFRVVVGLSHRGVRAETGRFADKLGVEVAARLYSRFDLGVGAGQLFKKNATVDVDAFGRIFLFDLPNPGGPYVGGGAVLNHRRRGYLTLGFFGGSGLFFELQFRAGDERPVAVIPAFGLRGSFP